MLNRNTKVRSLAEELKEIGLDPEKTIGQINRTTKLVESRAFGSQGGGAPSYLRPVKPVKALSEATESTDYDDDGDGIDLSEAVKMVKQRRIGAAEKAKTRRERMHNRGKIKQAGKAYRRGKGKRVIKRHAKVTKRIGVAGMQRLAKGRKKVMTQGDSPLSNLREDLNSAEGIEIGSSNSTNALEDAARNAGWLAMYIGEIFEAVGDLQSADTLFDASDASADLAEQLSGDITEEDLTEEQSQMLERVLGTLVKALRMYEAMGSPSLFDAFDLAEMDGDDDEDEDEDEDDDEDDEDEDEDDDEDE